MITPDQAREHMLTARERAAKTIADAIHCFCAGGDPDATIKLTPCSDALIAELQPYQAAGWLVSFHHDHASLTLPAVLS